MRKNKLPGEYYSDEGMISAKILSDGENLITNVGTAEPMDQIKTNIEMFLGKDEIQKWALFISACGGIGFILKEEAKSLNMGPLGETRTIHNVPDADGKVADSLEAHTYEVYG